MKFRKDIKAKLKVVNFEKNGRVNQIQINKYYPTFKFFDNYYDVFLSNPEIEYVKSDESIELSIQFKFPIQQIYKFKVGDKFELTEGLRTVMRGRITKILNTSFNESFYHQMSERSIEELEEDYWEELTEYPTPLVAKCYELRKLKLGNLINSDLRILLSQEIGVKFIINQIISVLLENLLIETKYFKGDLLKTTLSKINLNWGEANIFKRDLILKCQIEMEKIQNCDDLGRKDKEEILRIVDYNNKT